MMKYIANKINSDESLKLLLENHHKLVIYGAGYYGQTLKKYVRRYQGIDLVNFAVSDRSHISSQGCELKVLPLEEYSRESVLVIAVSEQHQDDLMENAWKLGFTNNWVLLNEYVRYMQALLDDQRLAIKEKLSFEVHITEHCNLNCRGCYHFSPLANEEFLDIAEYERDIDRIKEICGQKIERITLLGGEPLLHPDILEFFRVTRNYFSDTRIETLTNGILLEQMDDTFWQLCAENNITMCCTKYPIVVDYDAIERKASNYGLSIFYHNDVGAGEKMLIKYPFDINGTQDARVSFQKCTRSNLCITLKHGKLYMCPMAAHAHLAREYFGIQSLELSERDYIDIYSNVEMKDIMRFFTEPIDFCKYCNLQKRPEQMVWDVSRRHFDEWF